MQRRNDRQGLFVDRNGLPMVFHLPPGSTKKKLAPVIRQHGGEITSRNENDAIHLADERLWTSQLLLSSSESYWPSFILDCVEQGELLDMEQYKCSKGKDLMRSITSESGNDDSKSDDFDFDDIYHSTSKKKGRIVYTLAEDMKILKYLMDNMEYRRAKGVAVWRLMEKLQITPHTSQSMMTRYRKIILPNIDEYNIPDSWKARLTGDIAQFASTPRSPTSSLTSTAFPVLPSTSRGDGQAQASSSGRSAPHTVSGWIKSCKQRTTTMTREAEKEDEHFSADDDDEFIEDVESEEEEEETTSHSTHHGWQNNLRSRSGDGGVDQPQQERPSKRQTELADSSSNGSETGDSFDKQLMSITNSQECDNGDDDIAGGGDRTCLRKSARLLDDERDGEPTRLRSGARIGDNYSTSDQNKSARVPCGKGTEANLKNNVANHDHPVKKRRMGKKDAEAPEDAVLPNVRHHKKGLHRLLPQDANWRSRSPSKSPEKETEPKSPQKQSTSKSPQEQSSKTSTKETTSRPQKESSSKSPQKEREESSSPGKGTTSGRSPGKRTSSPAADRAARDDEPAQDTGDNRRQTRVSPCHTRVVTLRSGHQLPFTDQSPTLSTSSTLPCPVTPPVAARVLGTKLTEREDYVPNSTSSSPSQSDDNFPALSRNAIKDNKKKTVKRMTALGVIRNLSEEFDLTLKEATVLFRRNSGHVNATRYWIMTGRTLPGHTYWTPADDRVLLTCDCDGPEWQRLKNKYGTIAVMKRVEWLTPR